MQSTLTKLIIENFNVITYLITSKKNQFETKFEKL